MNAKQALQHFEDRGANGAVEVIVYPAGELAETILRALRLLAAAEANDGSTPETGTLIRFEFESTEQPFPAHALLALIQLARLLERERNGLAARVRELEEDAVRLERLAEHRVSAETIGRPNRPLFTVQSSLTALRECIDAIELAARSKP